MLFNSYIFILAFLPVSFFLFWYGGHSSRWRLGFMTLASYAFYSWWQFEGWGDFVDSLSISSLSDLGNSLWRWRFTIIMVVSSSVDYWAAKLIVRAPPANISRRRLLLGLSLAANLGLLGFFKYFGFFTQIADEISQFVGGGPIPIVSIILPVGISFYTFESMSYVIDIYRGIATPARSYLDYACFISFFPHLVAGPIIRYSDILHQFHEEAWARSRPDWYQVNVGLLLFTMGMAKKLLVADMIAVRISPLWQAFGDGESLGVIGSWAAVLGYTFRIYFDFSAYSDMATGLGHLFGVRLPQNFDSPYKATDPSDFWKRWHISLSAWLRDYLYIPLGGSRGGKQSRNLMITMLLGGLWHGAAWLFIVWGAWHGLILVIFHGLKKKNWIPSNDSWPGLAFNRGVTFLLVVIGWVFFRTADVSTSSYGLSSITPALRMLEEMIGLHGLEASTSLAKVGMNFWGVMAGCWAWCNFAPNSNVVAYGAAPSFHRLALAGALFAISFLQMGTGVDFLYFRF